MERFEFGDILSNVVTSSATLGCDQCWEQGGGNYDCQNQKWMGEVRGATALVYYKNTLFPLAGKGTQPVPDQQCCTVSVRLECYDIRMMRWMYSMTPKGEEVS